MNLHQTLGIPPSIQNIREHPEEMGVYIFDYLYGKNSRGEDAFLRNLTIYPYYIFSMKAVEFDCHFGHCDREDILEFKHYNQGQVDRDYYFDRNFLEWVMTVFTSEQKELIEKSRLLVELYMSNIEKVIPEYKPSMKRKM